SASRRPSCACCSSSPARRAGCTAASNCWSRCGSTGTSATRGSWTRACSRCVGSGTGSGRCEPPVTPRPSLGLRARLLFAFALLVVVTAAAVAGGIYVQARNAILQRTQDAAVLAMTSRLEALYPLRNPAPGPAELGEIAAAVTDQDSSAVAIYHGTLSPAGDRPRAVPGAPAMGPPGRGRPS